MSAASETSGIGMAERRLFLPYQRRWILGKSRMKIMEKARQIGMSWATAYSAVRRAAQQGARQDVWVSSRDEVQARLFLQDCKTWAQVLSLAAQDLGEVVVGDDGRSSASVLEFASGRRIYSLSSNPNALAGKRGHVILDEFALHADQRTLFRVARPVIQWGGQLEIISTHRGAGTVFAELIRDIVERGNPMGWSHHRITIQDAVAQGLVEKINAKTGETISREEFLARVRAECVDEEMWLQEYCCVPADESAAFLTYDLIAGCEYPTGEKWETDLVSCQNPVYVGVDVGREHDLTVIWALENVAGLYMTRRVIELKKQAFEAQEAALYELLGKPCVRRCCIDQTGIGRQFTERAQRRFGRYRVEGITFTGPVKEDLAYPVRAAFEDRSIRIPYTNAIRADLRSIKKETTAAGNIRFSADRGPGGHADRFWALALALHAGKRGGGPVEAQASRVGTYGESGRARNFWRPDPDEAGRETAESLIMV